MNKKGFTLVELLAVIAILAILVIIALPNVLKMYNNAKKNTFLTEAKTVYSEVSKKYISESMKGNKLSYISSEDNTKLDMTGNKLKYCIKLDNNGKITAMKVGNDNYYLFFDGSKDISKIDLNDAYDGKYVQDKCNANTTITKDGKQPLPPEKACTYDGEINAGDTIQIGAYSYQYKRDYDAKFENALDDDPKLVELTADEFRAELTNKESTDPVTEAPCTTINGKTVTSMAGMFVNSKAKSIDLSSFNTSRITNMALMFSYSSATTLDLSNFDTSKVTNMAEMFTGTKITALNLSNFDTSKVTNMAGMFVDSKATTLNLSSFDTSKVTNMKGMFAYSSATTLDLNNFKTPNVIDMIGMFMGSAAITLDLSNFEISKTANITSMFIECKATTGYAKDADTVAKFNDSSVTNIPDTLKFAVKN